MESISKKKSSGSSNLLAPGFRFHPTDEELVLYYLTRKICGKALRFDAISDVDVYKFEPWDLPCMSKLKTRDLEWYFFSVLDKKYGNRARTNRATEKGYWKTTGKDRAVNNRKEIVGMKKTLVYHSGRAPKGHRTNWVMHEYRLGNLELEKSGIVQDAIVLCRIFEKSGAGPKNGEQYGAPFVEEEWDFDDDLELVYKEESSGKDNFGNDACLVAHDHHQIIGSDVPLAISPPPLNFQSSDGSCDGETAESFTDTQKPGEPNQSDDNNVHNLPAPYEMGVVKPANHEYVDESNNSGDHEYLDYLLDEPYMDSCDNLQFGDEGFIETNDLLNSVETDNSGDDMVQEYLSYFDANDDQFFIDDMMLVNEDLVQNRALILQKELDLGIEQSTLLSRKLIDNNGNDVKASDKQETEKNQAVSQYPFIRKASQMLGNIPAPSAFAAEFPSKDAIVRLNSAHVIKIRNLNMGGANGTNRSSSQHEDFNIVLSFGFARGDNDSARLESSVKVFPGKTVSAISRSWFNLLFFWGILILSMSFKIGTYVCAN